MNDNLYMIKPTVVIIDDVPTNIKVIHSCLGDDFNICFAVNGEEGIQLVRQTKPDIILLDVVMPGMDGYEVCSKLKADPDTRKIPIIFVTTRNEIDAETKGLTLGGVDYVTKPIIPAILKVRVTTHIELKRQRDYLEHLLDYDSLTGLANRRHFDETLIKEWSRGTRSHLPLSVIMIDIDFFKAFNDIYGHPAGDDCLRKVAQAFSSVITRKGCDLIARYGGEEFVAILVDTDRKGGRIVAERLKTSVSNLALPHVRSAVADHVTASFGVATMVPTLDQDPTALTAAADQMLYQAKAEGRNRIAV